MAHTSDVSAKNSPGIIEITNIIRQKETCIDFMRRKGFLKNFCKCTKCNFDMKLVKRTAKVTSDCEMWFCGNCSSYSSIR